MTEFLLDLAMVLYEHDAHIGFHGDRMALNGQEKVSFITPDDCIDLGMTDINFSVIIKLIGDMNDFRRCNNG